MQHNKQDGGAGPLVLNPVYLSFHNDAYNTTSANIVDGRLNTFVLTTGGFPQDIILSVGESAAANISHVSLYLHDAKEIAIDKCTAQVPNIFEKMITHTLKRSKETSRQEEHFDLDMAGDGKGVKYLRLRILSGYSQFVGIFGIEVVGEESQQRIATLHSSPEVILQ